MRRLTFTLTALGVLQVADLVTTYVSLRMGGQELNPLGALALHHGFAGLVVAKAVLYLGSVLAGLTLARRGHIDRVIRITAALGIFFSGVVASNLLQLKGITT